ncbi:hypothetical protein SDC9_202561 [bioreactor metagenome]|uniref:Uncharacterized protein n=1 Tax=bioreactor metagenome TaxID=1076179 RepID=A0A645J5Y8_9ZZZZ
MEPGEPGDDDGGEAVSPGEAVLQPPLEPGEFAHSRDPCDGAGNEHDEDHVLQIVHPCKSGRLRVLAHDPDFVPPAGEFQDDPEKKGKKKSKENAPVNAGAPEDGEPG